jgi:hypothetical protein
MIKLVLFYSRTDKNYEKVKFFSEKFSLEKNYDLEQYNLEDDINIPGIYMENGRPILHVVDNGKIVTWMKGFSHDDLQLNFYDANVSNYLKKINTLIEEENEDKN